MQICQIVIAAASILFVLTCPGDAVRVETEIQTWLPEYADWTVPEKLLRGIFHAVDYYFYTAGINFFAFALVFLLALALFLSPGKKRQKALALGGALWLCLAVGTILLQRLGLLAKDLPIYNILKSLQCKHLCLVSQVCHPSYSEGRCWKIPN